MILKRFLTVLLALLVSSCLVKKKTTYGKSRSVTVSAGENSARSSNTVATKPNTSVKVSKVVKSAMAYVGTRYKFGGTTKKGMDCSGLVYISLKENGISFPRVSHQMANEGKRIDRNKVEKGDLLFFKTSKGGKKINHVGLVVKVNGRDVKFVHSSTSRGVMVSSLREGYWNGAFVKATRVL